MQQTISTGDAAHAELASSQLGTPSRKFTADQLAQIVTALEEPFEPREIKWRVTNTTADRRRGQVVGYADARAYTDRLNALFTVRGWTREYSVQVIPLLELWEPAFCDCRVGVSNPAGASVAACWASMPAAATQPHTAEAKKSEVLHVMEALLMSNLLRMD